MYKECRLQEILGGGKLLNNPKTSLKYNKLKNKISKALAFSLIELSIVLIIIGLLVAGVTGGASLIESAKTRSLINEIKNIERAYYSFYVIKGRIPGDLDENGMHGYRAQYAPGNIEKQPYLSSDFNSPYDGTVEGYGIPNQITSPFVELYLEKIFDFEPRNVSETNLSKLYASNGLPKLKTFTDYYILPIYRVKVCYNGEYDWRCNIVPGNYIEGVTELDGDGDFRITRVLKSIDKKIDDGTYNDGSFISDCNYDKSLQEKKGCRAFDYKIAIK